MSGDVTSLELFFRNPSSKMDELKLLERANMTPRSSLNKPALPSLPPRWSVVNWEVQLLFWWLVQTNHRKVMSCFQQASYEDETSRKNIVLLWYLVRIFSWHFWWIIQTPSMDLKIQPLSGNHNIFKCWEICAWVLELSLFYWVNFAAKRAFSLHVWSTTFLVKCHYNVLFMG